MAALSPQSVTVPGTRAAELVLPKGAAALAALIKDRAEAVHQLEKMLQDHPLTQTLTSMPGRHGARVDLGPGCVSRALARSLTSTNVNRTDES